MRSRNVKPGFFQNEQLAELPPETRLLFIGLWMLADREGRLEDRPKRIKMQIFPADTWDVVPMLDQLAHTGLIIRYQIDDAKYIEIPKFLQHQSPHVREKESVIPPRQCQGTTKVVPEHSQDRLNPESLLLNPESPSTKGADAPVRDKLWTLVPTVVGGSKADRSFVGKLVKEHGEGPVLAALEQTKSHGTGDPHAYLQGILREKDPPAGWGAFDD